MIEKDWKCGNCKHYEGNGAGKHFCGYFDVNPLPDCVDVFDNSGEKWAAAFSVSRDDGSECPCFDLVQPTPPSQLDRIEAKLDSLIQSQLSMVLRPRE